MVETALRRALGTTGAPMMLAVTLEMSTARASEPELVTDRPDVTESSLTVPSGWLQIELGFARTETDAGGIETTDTAYPETLVRVGWLGRLEARIGWDGHREIDVTGAGGASGTGDASLGVKWAVVPPDRSETTVAVIAATSLPVGGREFTSDRLDPFVLLAASTPLGERVSVGANAGAAWSTTPESATDRDTTGDWLYSVSGDVSVTDRLGAYAELFGSSSISSGTDSPLSFDAGVTYLLTPRIQLDASFAVGLDGDAPDRAIGFGVSFLLPVTR